MATFTTKAFCQTLSPPSLCIFLTRTSYICFPLSYTNSQSHTFLFLCLLLAVCSSLLLYLWSLYSTPSLNYFFLYTSISPYISLDEVFLFDYPFLLYPKVKDNYHFPTPPFLFFNLLLGLLFCPQLPLSLSHFPPPVLSFVSLTPPRSWTKTLWGNSLVLCNKLCCLWLSTIFYENHVWVQLEFAHVPVWVCYLKSDQIKWGSKAARRQQGIHTFVFEYEMIKQPSNLQWQAGLANPLSHLQRPYPGNMPLRTQSPCSVIFISPSI